MAAAEEAAAHEELVGSGKSTLEVVTANVALLEEKNQADKATAITAVEKAAKKLKKKGKKK